MRDDRFGSDEREEQETQEAILGNAEARVIVNDLVARWAEFTHLPRTPENLNRVHDETLRMVDARLNDGTPTAQVPKLAEEIFRREIARIGA